MAKRMHGEAYIGKKIFKEFWGMEWDAKNVFVKQYVYIVEKKRLTKCENSRKYIRYQYNLPLKSKKY